MFEISREQRRDVTDEDLSDILNEMDIRRMCCRRTIIISPILPIMTTGPQFNIYKDTRVISMEMERITIGNKDPEF